MTNINTTTYIRKLVKMVYEKQKQIEQLKKALKNKQNAEGQSNLVNQIDYQFRTELENTSQQLRGVSQHILTMQNKMMELSEGLQEEITKNTNLEEELTEFKKKLVSCERLLDAKNQQILQKQQTIKKVTESVITYQKRETDLASLNRKMSEELIYLNKSELNNLQTICKLQKQIAILDQQLREREDQQTDIQKQLKEKRQSCQTLQNELSLCSQRADDAQTEVKDLNETLLILKDENQSLKKQLESLQNNFALKVSEFQLVNQTLKDYQQFAFQISQFIESAYTKHCCKGALRSSKKLLKQVQNCTGRFETAFCKLNKLQIWMDSTAQKLEKILQQQEFPCRTLENLSVIVHSVEQKLQLCDLTQRIEKQKVQMDKNEEQLLDNLQKQCQKSLDRDRSKIVQLDEVKEILKITKEVNRELMDQINKKEHVINECRKVYQQLLTNKTTPLNKNIQSLLNIKF